MKRQNEISFEKAAQQLFLKDNILILTHANPDGDCIGSACAMYLMLKKVGKRVKIACPSEIPKRLEFILEGIECEDVIQTSENLIKSGYDFDSAVSVDVASDTLLGDMLTLVEGKISLAFDHHQTNTICAQGVYVLPSASATGEIMYELLLKAQQEYKLDFIKIAANAIYASIASDTGCFCYSNTTAKTHLYASKLIESGAQASQINHRLFEIKTQKQFHAEKIAMDNMQTFFGGKLVISYITKKQLEEIEAQSSDADTCVQTIKMIEGCQAAAFIKEKEQNQYKVSLRTTEAVDAAYACKQLGGGGHIRAAGCTVEDTLENTIDIIKKVIQQQLQ